MKEKHKNGCNILIMIFTNLVKYVYSKKCLKQGRQPPTPPPSKVEVFVTWLRLRIGGRPAPIPNKVCDWLGKQWGW